MYLVSNLQKEMGTCFQNRKPLILTSLLHAIMFLSLFCFSKPSLEISSQNATSSFSLMSLSNQASDTSEQKVVTSKKKSNISQNTSQNLQGKSSDADSSSEIIYDAKNLGNPQPQYPLISKRRGEEGTVLIRAFVDEAGLASKVEIFKSSSFYLLDNAALEAVRKWHFIPAKQFGQYISSSAIIPVTFKLQQSHES